jgi:hypothetical protein
MNGSLEFLLDASVVLHATFRRSRGSRSRLARSLGWFVRHGDDIAPDEPQAERALFRMA